MNGNDTQLSIVLELIDNASKQLEAAQGQFAQFSDGVAQSIRDASLPIIQLEEDVGNAVAKAGETISTATSEASDLVVKYWDDASTGATKAIGEIPLAWESANAQVQASVDALTARFDEDTQQIAASAQSAGQAWAQGLDAGIAGGVSTAEESLSGLKRSTDGFMGYFALVMGASIAGQVGGGLTGAYTSTISAAAAGAQTFKIQQLTSEIDKQKATIATAQASLTHMTGTTAEFAAKQQSVAATVEAARVKIEQLQRQLAPLTAAAQVSSAYTLAYADATQKLTTDWSTFLATVGTPQMNYLTGTYGWIDKIVNRMTDWANAYPGLAGAIDSSLGVLGTLFSALSGVLNMLAGLKVAVMILGGQNGALAVLNAALFTSTPLLEGIGMIALPTAAFAAFAAAVVLINNAFNGMQSAVNNAKSAAATANSVINGPQWQALLAKAKATDPALYAKMELEQGNTQTQSNRTSQLNGGYSGFLGGLDAVGNWLNTTTLPHMATGGIVNSPTLALIGEAGPEAVIPLSAFSGGSSLAGRGSSGGAGIVININGGNYLDSTGASMIGNALAKKVLNSLRTRNYAP